MPQHSDLVPMMTADQVNRLMAKVYPQLNEHGRDYEAIDVVPGGCRVRLNATDRHLRPGGTVSGPCLFTLADIGNAPYVTRLDHLKFLPQMTARRPLAAKWYERIKARPGYQDALAKWFNAKYLPLMEEKGTEAWPSVSELLSV